MSSSKSSFALTRAFMTVGKLLICSTLYRGRPLFVKDLSHSLIHVAICCPQLSCMILCSWNISQIYHSKFGLSLTPKPMEKRIVASTKASVLSTETTTQLFEHRGPPLTIVRLPFVVLSLSSTISWAISGPLRGPNQSAS